MNLNIKIRWNHAIDSHHEGDVTFVPVDSNHANSHEDLLNAIDDKIGEYDEGIDFEIINEDELLTGENK